MNNETLLLRQVNPAFIHNGRVSSQVFRPTPKDQNLLSVYDGDQISPEDAHAHYTEIKRCKSVGVLGVTINECYDLELEARPDPAPFPEHAIIDFSAHTRKAVESKAKILRNWAVERDWCFQDTGT